MSEASQPSQITVIEPVANWGIIDFKEVYQYRDLIFFMVWRGIKVAYAQSIVGFGWALIQPAIQILVFSLVFGGLLNVDTDGIPYPLLTTVAVIPWNYMSATMTAASSNLVNSASLLGKIYFPRVIYLIAPCVGNLIPFFVSAVLIVAVGLYYQVPPNAQWVYLPIFFLLMFLLPLSISLWLASLALRFRDVQIVMSYFMRMLIYIVPVMYPSQAVTEALRPYFILNPLVGVIEGFRSCLLGQPIYWDSLTTSVVITLLLLVSGAVYFRRMERIVVDVI